MTTETVTLETRTGKLLGHAEIHSSVDHYPEDLLILDRYPVEYHLDRIEEGHLVYRPSGKYVVRANSFHPAKP